MGCYKAAEGQLGGVGLRGVLYSVYRLSEAGGTVQWRARRLLRSAQASCTMEPVGAALRGHFPADTLCGNPPAIGGER